MIDHIYLVKLSDPDGDELDWLLEGRNEQPGDENGLCVLPSNACGHDSSRHVVRP